MSRTGTSRPADGRPDAVRGRWPGGVAARRYGDGWGSASYYRPHGEAGLAEPAEPEPEYEYFGLGHEGKTHMDRFDVSVGDSGQDRYVVTVRGELDLATADRLWTELEPLLEPKAVVVLDGTGITFLDSSGLRVLLQAGNRASAGGAAFRLVAPQPAVQRVLELAGTGSHLQTRETVPAALDG